MNNDKRQAGACEFDEACCGAIIRHTQAGNSKLGANHDDALIYKSTEIFSALSDSTRFKILCALADGELCVNHIVEACDVSQSAISHQLRLLKDRGLVKSKRVGQNFVYSLSDEHVRSLIIIGLEHASEKEE